MLQIITEWGEKYAKLSISLFLLQESEKNEQYPQTQREQTGKNLRWKLI